jgi:branched-chain amino acid transport system permease protein
VQRYFKWGISLFSVLGILLPLVKNEPFYYTLGVICVLNAILALSVHLMLRINQLSLAQAGFMGIGAYASALLSKDFGMSFILALIVSSLIAALCAAVISMVILKVKGVQFVLLTFALGQAIVLVFTEWVYPFGGSGGFVGIPAAKLGEISLKDKQFFYLFSLVLLAVCVLIAWKLLSGKVGAILKGLSANEPLMQSLGINTLRYRRLVFVISALLAGLSGSAYAHFIGYISPDAFHVMTSVNALIMNVIGGTATLFGPLLGALLIVPLPEFFRGTVVYLQLFYGITLVLLMVFLPKGITGLAGKWAHKGGQ